MTMISSIIIFSRKGEIIFSRYFRDINTSIIESLRARLTQHKSLITPLLKIDEVTFAYTLAGNLWITASCHRNANVTSIFYFLSKLCVLFSDLKINVDAESFFTQRYYIIQMIDEMIDYGMVQNTDLNSLNDLLNISGQKSLMSFFKSTPECPPANITSQVTGQVSWRKGVAKFNQNELALDVRETVHCLISAQGVVLSSSVDGVITLNTRLNGNPELRLGINDKALFDKSDEKKSSSKGGIDFDDCSFHQCVRLNKYDQSKSITFIPPDGSFQLLKYRTTEDIILPLKIISMIKDLGNGKEETRIVLTGNFDKSILAKRIILTIKTPKNVVKTDLKSTKGRTKYDKATNSILWKITKLNGGEDAEVVAIVETPTTKTILDVESTINKRPPVTIDFSVPFSCSGLRVRYLRVLETKLNYNDSTVLKWIRYLSNGGVNYQFRL